MGATTKLNIGKIPVSKGEYQDGTTYQRLNQVTMLGSTYQSKIDDNTSAPAQMGADGAVENINTDKWLCIAVGNVSAARKVVYNNETSGLEAGNVQEAIDEVGSKVSNLSASLKGNISENTIKVNTLGTTNIKLKLQKGNIIKFTSTASKEITVYLKKSEEDFMSVIVGKNAVLTLIDDYNTITIYNPDGLIFDLTYCIIADRGLIDKTANKDFISYYYLNQKSGISTLSYSLLGLDAGNVLTLSFDNIDGNLPTLYLVNGEKSTNFGQVVPNKKIYLKESYDTIKLYNKVASSYSVEISVRNKNNLDNEIDVMNAELIGTVDKEINTLSNKTIGYSENIKGSFNGETVDISNLHLYEGATVDITISNKSKDIVNYLYLIRENGSYISLRISNNIKITLKESFNILRIYKSENTFDYRVNVICKDLVEKAKVYEYKLKEEGRTTSIYNFIKGLEFGNKLIINDIKKSEDAKLNLYLDDIRIGEIYNGMTIPLDKEYQAINVYSKQIESYEIGFKIEQDSVDKALTDKALYYRGEVSNYFANINLDGNLKKDSVIEVIISGYKGSTLMCYLYRDDESYKSIGNISTGNFKYTLKEDYKYIKLYDSTKSLEAPYSYTIKITQKALLYKEACRFMFPHKLRMLILGDSYSEMKYWVGGMLEYLPSDTEVINLAVGSATVKDKYKDYVTYPYSSRPKQSISDGNKNTFACQIEKLKRLMAGTDLDEGENQIYKTENEYPNVIIIEGGQNDTFDDDNVETDYYSQFVKQVTDVYVLNKNQNEASKGSAFIKTPISEVDRTNFAGAYRYLVEELRSIFHKAQIFLTTTSTLGYWRYNVLERRYKEAAQQRKCANLLGVSLIDWNAEGSISFLDNYPTGNGTEDSPYNLACKTKETSDLMHPNNIGARKYGRLAANVIKTKYLDFMSINDLDARF